MMTLSGYCCAPRVTTMRPADARSTVAFVTSLWARILACKRTKRRHGAAERLFYVVLTFLSYF